MYYRTFVANVNRYFCLRAMCFWKFLENNIEKYEFKNLKIFNYIPNIWKQKSIYSHFHPTRKYRLVGYKLIHDDL